MTRVPSSAAVPFGLLIGAGTPREAAARALAYAFFFYTEEAVTVVLVAAC
jgi:hypothetical protein